ncbi:MAG: TetR/AcrR family transcriptional regulator [Hyphomicrobiales bacterium]
MARTIAVDHDIKREHILQAAAKVFARSGFHGASMSQVAEACGLSKPAIYHYYDGKEALLFDMLDGHLQKLRDRIVAVTSNGMAPDAHLRAVIVEVLLAYRGADNAHRVQTVDARVLPDEQQAVLRSYQVEMIEHISTILREVAPEVFDGDRRKLRATTMSIFGMLNWFYMWNDDDSEEARISYANLVADLTLNGVQGL